MRLQAPRLLRRNLLAFPRNPSSTANTGMFREINLEHLSAKKDAAALGCGAFVWKRFQETRFHESGQMSVLSKGFHLPQAFFACCAKSLLLLEKFNQNTAFFIFVLQGVPMLPSGFVSSKRLIGTLLCSVTLALTGCGIGMSAPSSNVSISDEAVPVYGSVFGGQTPITHAHIYLLASGTAGYGAANSPLLATYYDAADTNGAFHFMKQPSGTYPNTGTSWTCPSSGDPIIYLLSVGGDPQSGTDSSVSNPVAVLAAALGPCSTISSNTFIQMNEISTVGFAVAFAQYLSPGSSIGGEILGTSGSSQGSLGLLNAWQKLSHNLIAPAIGAAVSSVTYSGTGTATGVTITATPESGKLIAMANILASCVNNSNTSSTPTDINCKTLLDSAKPPFLASATSVGGSFSAAKRHTSSCDLYGDQSCQSDGCRRQHSRHGVRCQRRFGSYERCLSF